jgi:hypothetical protein
MLAFRFVLCEDYGEGQEKEPDMAIKVQWEADGPFAICDSPAEAMELMRQARLSVNAATRTSSQSNGDRLDSSKRTAGDRTELVIASINGKARSLLKSLIDYPQGIEGGEFGKVCGIDPAGFGGVLGGISKKAKEVDLKIEELVQSEARFEGDRRYRWLAPTKLLLQHKDRLQ